ncbi:MAG: S9 family peptidase [Proteobacteria bacterium]|nr:S9 family peptidase [Pseudomonadota bacterium]
MKHFRLAAITGALALSMFAHGATAQSAAAQAAPARAPMDLFYGYDSFRSADISPSGRYVTAIHREAVGDVLIVIDLQTQHISQLSVAREDQHLQLTFARFKSDDRIIFGLTQKVHVVRDRNTVGVGRTIQVADDAWEYDSRVYAIGVDGQNLHSLYDPSAQQGFPREFSAAIIDILENDPNNVLLGVPNYGGAELWKVNIATGEHTALDHGTYWTIGWIVDNEGTPVLRRDLVDSGRGIAWLRRSRSQRNWQEVVRFRGAEGANSGPTFDGIGPAGQPGQVFVLARRDGDDTSGLFVYDTASGQYTQTVESNPNFDVDDVVRDAHANTILAACWWAQRWTCNPKDESFGRQWTRITHALGDNVNVRFVDRSDDGNRWLIRTNGPQDLGSYYLLDLNAHQLRVIFGARAQVDPALLPTERVVEYTTSDGQHQWGYLWIPPGVANARNLPTIVMPHGGPESRDTWGEAFVMPFATQGYAVFQPNFRGGGGFGRHFVESGYHQWGQRMQEDVSDGLHALVQQGITDPHRVCIWGWSYGGYVALTASFQNADIYKCSVAGAGISDMSAMLRWTRDGDRDRDASGGSGGGSQSMSYRYWTEAMGDLDRDHDMLVAHSAAQNAARVGMPLLLLHGDEDETVPIEQSHIMERAMQQAGHPVRLVTLPGISHYYIPDQGDAWRTVFTESLGFIQQNIGPGVAPGSQ